MDTSLFLAAREGNVEALRKLLQDDPLLLEYATISSTHTPLHIASMLGHLNFVRELIKCKTNIVNYVKELDQHGFSAIHLACANGHHEVVRELLEISDELCNLRGKDGMTPLHCACIKARIETIRHLLSVSSAIISEVTVRKETALHLAVKNNRFQALEILVEQLKKNNLLEILNSKDDEGDTILHLAAARRNRQAIALLLECNITNRGVVQVNAMNKCRLTALDLVMLFPCDSSCDDIERLLKQGGAERGRFLIDNTICPQHPQNLISHSSQQQTISHSRSQKPKNLSQEEIPDWTNHFKFKLGESNPDQVRSDLLVVAALLATATYQACLSPPGGIREDGTNEGMSRLSLSTPLLFIFFMVFNSAGFYISIFLIFALTTNFPLRFELLLATSAMSFTYACAMGSLSPPGTKRAIITSIVVIIASFVPVLSTLIRLRHKKRLEAKLIAQRRNQNP